MYKVSMHFHHNFYENFIGTLPEITPCVLTSSMEECKPQPRIWEMRLHDRARSKWSMYIQGHITIMLQEETLLMEVTGALVIRTIQNMHITYVKCTESPPQTQKTGTNKSIKIVGYQFLIQQTLVAGVRASTTLGTLKVEPSQLLPRSHCRSTTFFGSLPVSFCGGFG